MASFGKISFMICMFMLTLSFFNRASAGDPDMLQDLCVADRDSGILVNGFVCKANASANDFFSSILAKPGATNNPLRSKVTAANVVTAVPGLNTLGVSMARIDYAPGGENPPHTHPRASEMIFVLEGELDVGFITTANVLISKHIQKGDVFVFPRGLIHFQINNGRVPAAVIAGFNSQFPGTQQVATALFAASPPVPNNVLANAFKIGDKEVEKIKAGLA